MAEALTADSNNYVSNPVAVRRMLDVLKERHLVDADSEGRWRVKAVLEETVHKDLNPSQLALQMLQLAKELRRWVQGNNGPIDINDWAGRFCERVEALKEEAKREHAEVDPWLSKLPSAAGDVRRIADALERVARRLP